jgi:hypothetical protein
MRSLIVVLLIALASTVSAGSIRPAAVVTTADEDVALRGFVKRANAATCASVGLAKGCTDAEAKAKNPALTIFAVTAAGYQDYLTVLVASTIHDHAAQEIARKAAADVAGAYKAATPAIQAQVDALLGTQ